MTGAATPSLLQRFAGWRGHGLIALVARLYLGGVFIYACFHKIRDPAGFALDVATYQLLPLSLVNAFAITVPWIELCAGVLLIIGVRVRAAALVIALLMVAFMIALGSALHHGLSLSCGCFAAAGTADPISGWTMLRDLGWLALGLYVLALDRRPIGLLSLFAHRAGTRESAH